ncbi:MAG: hypothetical protein U0807_07995 [Candidatus Binatia bacterium]
MSSAAALLDRLGRPGQLRLGTTLSRPAPPLPTGLVDLDEALGGGLPRGRVSEITGARSHGRTGLACRIAASATRAGETIAWIDPEDALDPEAAAGAGMALGRTLWVRPRAQDEAARATEIVLGAGGFGLVVLDLGDGARLPGVRAVWPRLVRAAEQTRTALLVASARSAAGASAAVGLAVTGRRVRWSGGRGRLVLLDGLDARITVVRSRVGRPGAACVVRQACA